MISDQQQVGDDVYRFLLRATMGWFRGISIGIVSKNRATACWASERIFKVAIGSYLGHPHCLKVILTTLIYIYIVRTIVLHPHISLRHDEKAISLQCDRWMPIGQFSSLAIVSTNIYYCSIK